MPQIYKLDYRLSKLNKEKTVEAVFTKDTNGHSFI